MDEIVKTNQQSGIQLRSGYGHSLNMTDRVRMVTVLNFSLDSAFSKLGGGAVSSQQIFQRARFVMEGVERSLMLAAYLVEVLGRDGWRVQLEGSSVKACHPEIASFEAAVQRLKDLELSHLLEQLPVESTNVLM